MGSRQGGQAVQMSIKRYDVGMTTENNPHGFNHSFPWVYEAEHGKYVEWEDYARLKAEVERLDILCKQVSRQHSDISCENIMLRKAGDAMAEIVNGTYCVEPPQALKDWDAAKEGKQP